MTQEHYEFGDRLGRFFERNGLPRMAGRVMGRLLVSVPAEQTFDDLVEVVGASRSSVSVATQWLVKLGFVERFGIPGDRRDRYRLSDDAWTTVLMQDIETASELRSLAEDGLKLMKGARRNERRRLDEMREFYTFLEDALKPQLSEWKKIRAARARRGG